MKRDRTTQVVLVLTLLVLSAGSALGMVPEPDKIVYGTITISNQAITANDGYRAYNVSNYVVEVRTNPAGPAIHSYAMGSISNYHPYFYGVRRTTLEAYPSKLASDILLMDTLYVVLLRDGVAISQTVYVATERAEWRFDFGPVADSDFDGLTDLDEYDIYHTDPMDSDTDGDGVTDGHEILVLGTLPLIPDTDGDGYSDGHELANLTDPSDSNSLPASISGAVTYGGPLTGTIWVTASRYTNNNQVLVLTGTNYVAITGLVYTSAGQITNFAVEAWIRTTSTLQNVIASWDRTAAWQLTVGADASGAVSFASTDAGGQTRDLKGYARVNDGRWHHVAGTYEAATGTKRIYVDGFLDMIQSNAHAAGIGLVGGPSIGTRYGFLGAQSLASTYDGTRGPLAFNGRMDNVRIWSRALSPVEVRSNMYAELTGAEADLTACWNFENTSANDLSPNGYHGTLKRGASMAVEDYGLVRNVAIGLPGAYVITNLPTLADYLVVAYRDSNGNGRRDYWEAWGSYTSNPLFLVADTAGVDVAMEDPPQRTFPVPGSFEAEDFDLGGEGTGYHDATPANQGGAYRPEEAVDIAASATASNGYLVGWATAGEWMRYTINVSSAGSYNVSVRVACASAGGTFNLTVDGVDMTGPIAVPNTGGWLNWAVVAKPGVNLAAGIHTARVVMVSNGASGFVGNFDNLQFTWLPGPNTAPKPVPGAWQAEDFDAGGEGVAYHDTAAVNQGGAYRPAEGVDIAVGATASNGHVVGWALAGEWIRYTIDVASDGFYNFSARVACSGGGGTFSLSVDGVDATGPIAVPNTGGWANWANAGKAGINLTAGMHTARVVMVSNGGSGFVGNFDQMALVPGAAPAWPALPGLLEAEDFDAGGEGVAYHDTTPANEGGQYRLAEAVDIAASATASNGYLVGWTKAAEWMRYTVNVTSSATYNLIIRVASLGTGGTFNVTVDGTDVTGPLTVPETGGWMAWSNLTQTGIGLTMGTHTVRVVMVSIGPSAYVGNFDAMQWVLQGVPPPGLARSSAARRGGRVSGSASDLRSGSVQRPVGVLTSDDGEDSKPGWQAVDGDTNTAWVGEAGAGGWWIALTYDPVLSMSGVTVDLAPASQSNVLYLWSRDADEWTPFDPSLMSNTVPLEYLWLIFEDDGSGQTPILREINVESDR